jgi:hypothetical protein
VVSGLPSTAQSFVPWLASPVRASDARCSIVSASWIRPTEEVADNRPIRVQATLQKLKLHPEPESSFILTRTNVLPAYNVQTVVVHNIL